MRWNWQEKSCSQSLGDFFIYIGKIAARFSLYIDVLRVLYVAGCAKLILPHSPVPCYPAQASKVVGHFWSGMAQLAWKLVSSCVFVKFKFCQILGPEKPVFGPKIGKVPNPNLTGISVLNSTFFVFQYLTVLFLDFITKVAFLWKMNFAKFGAQKKPVLGPKFITASAWQRSLS